MLCEIYVIEYVVIIELVFIIAKATQKSTKIKLIYQSYIGNFYNNIYLLI